MNPTSLSESSNTHPIPGRATYLQGLAFVAPAILAWAFSTVFVFPKLQQIWQEAGFSSPNFQILFELAAFLAHHAVLLGLAMVAILVLLERRTAWWPRYRRLSVGLAVVVLNSAVFVLITGMLISALLVAPMLMHLK